MAIRIYFVLVCTSGLAVDIAVRVSLLPSFLPSFLPFFLSFLPSFLPSFFPPSFFPSFRPSFFFFFLCSKVVFSKARMTQFLTSHPYSTDWKLTWLLKKSIFPMHLPSLNVKTHQSNHRISYTSISVTKLLRLFFSRFYLCEYTPAPLPCTPPPSNVFGTPASPVIQHFLDFPALQISLPRSSFRPNLSRPSLYAVPGPNTLGTLYAVKLPEDEETRKRTNKQTRAASPEVRPLIWAWAACADWSTVSRLLSGREQQMAVVHTVWCCTPHNYTTCLWQLFRI